jgi:hypothetical protein
MLYQSAGDVLSRLDGSSAARRCGTVRAINEDSVRNVSDELIAACPRPLARNRDHWLAKCIHHVDTGIAVRSWEEGRRS